MKKIKKLLKTLSSWNVKTRKYNNIKHVVLGLFIFLTANIFVDAKLSGVILWCMAVGWELKQYFRYGVFDRKDVMLSIVPSIVLALVMWWAFEQKYFWKWIF